LISKEVVFEKVTMFSFENIGSAWQPCRSKERVSKEICSAEI